jgi:hypothetical protein
MAQGWQERRNAMFEKLFYRNGLVSVLLESSVPPSFTLGGFDENIKPTDSESVVRPARKSVKGIPRIIQRERTVRHTHNKQSAAKLSLYACR